MIFKRRSATLLVLLFGAFVANVSSDDFKFEHDDFQVVNSDPSNTATNPTSRYIYAKEVAQCPTGESKTMLTLLLQSLRWNEISEKKKEKAIKKLSRFFLVPRQFITVSDIHAPEILEMLKHSLNKSNNLLNTKESVARFEFMIGCGDKLFPNGKTIALHINEYMKFGALDELTGLPFTWWNIWSKHVKSRVQRTRREAADGSGSEEADYDDEEFIYDDDEEEEGESPVVATEAPRTRHNLVPSGVEIEPKKESQPRTKNERRKPDEESESNYDDEYDDTLPEEDVSEKDDNDSAPSSAATEPTTTKATRRTTFVEVTTSPSITEQETSPPTQPTTAAQTEAATEQPIVSVTTESPSESGDYEDANVPPRVEKRIPKTAVTAGKPFVIKVEENVFYDVEDKNNLTLELLDKDKAPISSTSWIRFNSAKREIYGLPLESDVSRYEFKLRATDSAGDSVEENVDITVQQHKSYRSANHEIYIQVKLEKNYESPVDWEIRLVRGIVEALDDGSTGSVVVREVRPNKYESNMFTFVFTNDSLPKDHCPKDELDELMTKLTKPALNEAMKREIIVRNVEKDLIGSCQERTPTKVHVPKNEQNFPPTVRNPVDQVAAYVGQLLVYEVPKDTFYDPEDQTELKLSLLNGDRSKLDPNHWLQFDAKNREFYGVPGPHEKSQQYILVAEDKNGLTTNDALIIEVKMGTYKRDHGAAFEYQLDIGHDQFNTAATKRKFIEGIARVFQDSDTSQILFKMAKKLQYAGRTSVVLQNRTLYRENRECPTAEIEKLRNILLRQDRSVRDEVKETIGNDFNVLKITVAPTGSCAGDDSYHHQEEITARPDDQETPIINQDVLITYVLPTAIILVMLLIALLIACILYKRRNTGKMELGDEEERKSFRSKGIPVIFQDELEEKPEILTKSPVILKDEKPPLLPQYNGLNQDDEDNMDQYIPPQPLMMGSRESRGKSPVTPSYRKPPPYVSP